MLRKTMMLLVLLVTCVLTAAAQTERASGTVVSEDGQPIVGASVLLVGTKMGTITDVDGHFTLSQIPVKPTR